MKISTITTTPLQQQLEEAEVVHVKIRHKQVNQLQTTKIVKLRTLQLKTRTSKIQDSRDNQKNMEIAGETKRIDSSRILPHHGEDG
jgi:hypothetical protein